MPRYRLGLPAWDGMAITPKGTVIELGEGVKPPYLAQLLPDDEEVPPTPAPKKTAKLEV
jgi:hypothetical protein